MQNAGLDEAQAGIKIAGRNINNLRYADAAAAAAKSLQSCPTLCDPIDSSPQGSPVPGILQARVLEWVAIDTTLMAESEEELKSLLMKMKEESGKSWFKAQHSENKDHGIRSHHFMGNRWGNSGNSVRLYFGGLQNHCRW